MARFQLVYRGWRLLCRGSNERGCPHNCCFCVYTVVEGKQVRVNPVNEVIKEMKQLYDLGVRGFWFTDAQFIPAKKHIEDAKILCKL